MRAYLVGGPYCGGSDFLHEDLPPNFVIAWACDHCHETHIIDEEAVPVEERGFNSAHRYRFNEENGKGWEYVDGELPDFSRYNEQRDLVPAGGLPNETWEGGN